MTLRTLASILLSGCSNSGLGLPPAVLDSGPDTDLGDTDGGSDTDTDTDVDTDPGDTPTGDSGTTDTGPLPDYTLEVTLSIDNQWEAWVDTIPVGNNLSWNPVNTYNSQVNIVDEGQHAVAIHARAGNSAGGFIAQVKLIDTPVSTTGDGSWKVTSVQPPASWTEPAFDDSGWAPVTACSPKEVKQEWGKEPAALRSVGAAWVWYQPCLNMGEAWFRYAVTTP